MNTKITAAVLGLGLLTSSPAAAQTEWTSSRPDGHAPIGIMGDHTHDAGELMFSYRFMSMSMDGNLDGSDEVAPALITQVGGPYGFTVAPLEMPMRMHMLGMMYAPSDRVTLMAMVDLVATTMNHRMRSGMEFETESGGLGDTKVSALVGVVEEGPSRLHLNLGASLPTGSIDERDQTPMSAPDEVALPYPMQTGTGTFALSPGATYLGMAERVSWGAQARAIVQLGENDRGYRVGDRVIATGWLALRAARVVSLSARTEYQVWEDVSGADPALDPTMAPTMRTDLRGGKRLSIPLGVNYWFDTGPLSGFRLLAEYEIPVWQKLSGPQLQADGTLILGAQLSVDPH